MGHESVRVLNGGLKKWKAEGAVPGRRRAVQALGAPLHADLQRRPRTRRWDVKAADRQSGRSDRRCARRRPVLPERYPSRVRVCAPAISRARGNVPFQSLLNADGTLKPAADLARIFSEAGVDTGRPSVASCGSGVTAGVVALALAVLLGRPDAAVYDGFLDEWGGDKSLPIETGPGTLTSQGSETESGRPSRRIDPKPRCASSKSSAIAPW